MVAMSIAILLALLPLAAQTARPPAADAASGSSGPPSPRPVVLVSIDSLRADRCSAWGHRPEHGTQSTTPFLDRVCAAGVRFADAQSTSSWTLPAHVSLMTGMHGLEHGVRSRGVRLSDDAETLAERLRDAGYRTAGFFSGPFLHPAWGLAQGFERYEAAPDDLRGDDATRAVLDVRPGLLAELHERSHDDARTSERVVDLALAWLDGVAADEPFFLFLHLWDPHYDYEPPPEVAAAFLPEDEARRSFHGFTGDWERGELAFVQALYDAEIRATDDQIARLWRGLEQRGFAERAVLVVTADHGDEFFEHGDKGHRKTLWEEVTHVPLALRADGLVPAGKTVTTPVSLVDVAPTLLDLVGIAPWSDRQGVSLRGTWDDAVARPRRDLLLDLAHERGGQLVALRRGLNKVIWDVGRGMVQVADLDEDPRELAPAVMQVDGPDAFVKLVRAAFEPWLGNEGWAEPLVDAPDAALERLEELGYTGDDD
jgi:arylsulfatase